MTMASKIVIMNEGRILQVGKPIEVYDNPNNRFVAGFIGSPAMNFLEAKLIQQDGGLWVDGGCRFPMQNKKYTLGIKVKRVILVFALNIFMTSIF